MRLYALQKTMRSMDLGAELGAKIYVFWGGREGAEVDAAKDARDALKWFREAINFLCDYSSPRATTAIRHGGEAERAARRHLPATVGPRLRSSRRSISPEMVGVNPEVAPRDDGRPQLLHASRRRSRPGSSSTSTSTTRSPAASTRTCASAPSTSRHFFLVKLLEEAGYDGPRHFDAHAYRTEDAEGVWDFAAGCMRTYLALAERARHFDALPEVQEALAAASTPELAEPSVSGDGADALKAEADRLDELAARGYFNERLDQLLIEVLMGVR